MQLNQGDQSILSYFSSSSDAQQAAQQLKKAGLVPEPGSLQIDRISRYGGEINAEYNPPLSSARTLSGITLYSDDAGPEGKPNPLLAASDSASGLGNPDADSVMGRSFMLTLVTASENTEEAVKIIKINGGTV